MKCGLLVQSYTYPVCTSFKVFYFCRAALYKYNGIRGVFINAFWLRTTATTRWSPQNQLSVWGGNQVTAGIKVNTNAFDCDWCKRCYSHSALIANSILRFVALSFNGHTASFAVRDKRRFITSLSFKSARENKARYKFIGGLLITQYTAPDNRKLSYGVVDFYLSQIYFTKVYKYSLWNRVQGGKLQTFTYRKTRFRSYTKVMLN